jgi:hypothetical protein
MSNTSKATIHCVGPDRDGYADFIARIDAAGRRLPFVKCRDDMGAFDEPLKYWPDLLTVGAFTQFDRLPFDLAAFVVRADKNPKVHVWEVLNEDDAPSTYKAKADLYISLAPYFKSRGWALCLFNCSSGTPPYPLEDNGVSYAEIARCCKWFIDNGYEAYLGLHEYQSSGGTIGRFKVLADYLAARNALLPILITEYGFETHPGDVKFMEMVKANDPLYMADDRVMGCALWTLGGGGWGGSNFETALPQLGEYIATVNEGGEPEPMSKIVGVHSRAGGGDLVALDKTTIGLAGTALNGFKFTTQDARNNHAAVNALGIDSANCITRLFWTPGNLTAPPTAAQLFEIFKTPIQENIADGILWFEFLNEPNLIAEWKWSAAEFVELAKSTIALIRAAFPKALIISPGLAPDAATVPTWDAAFASGGLYAACDGIGAHSYGTQPAHLNDDNELRYYRRFASRLTGTQKIWITEASIKWYSITPRTVGLLYGEYANTLEDYVAGVWFFVLQGTDFAVSGEEWTTHQDIARGLAAYVPIEPPADEWVLDYWRDMDTGENLGSANPLQYTVKRSAHIRAITKLVGPPVPVVYQVVADTDGHGTATGSGAYVYDTVVPFTFTP